MGAFYAEINRQGNFLVSSGSFDGGLFSQKHAREKGGREDGPGDRGSVGQASGQAGAGDADGADRQRLNGCERESKAKMPQQLAVRSRPRLHKRPSIWSVRREKRLAFEPSCTGRTAQLLGGRGGLGPFLIGPPLLLNILVLQSSLG